MKNILELKTDGVVNSGDRKFTRLIGGFGEDKPMFTIWQAGELLGLRTGDVNENFERNENQFERGVDFIDLKCLNVSNVKSENVDITSFLKSIGLTHHKYGRTKQWLAFSFSGMMKLVKISQSKESWEIYDKFLEDYFKTKAENKDMEETIKEEIEFLKEQKAMLLGKSLMEDDMSIRMEYLTQSEDMTKRLTKLEKTLSKDEAKRETVEKLKPELHMAELLKKAKGVFDMGDFAKILDIKGMGKINMFRWLRDKGMLMSGNKPYQRFTKYFKLTPTLKNGYINNATQLKPAGVPYVIKKLIEDGMIVTKTPEQILEELGAFN